MGARGVGPHRGAVRDRVARRSGSSRAVAAVHTEVFGTIDDVARAKGELVEALPADGTAVLNADDPRVAAMADRTDGRGGHLRRTAATCGPRTWSSTTTSVPRSGWRRRGGAPTVAPRRARRPPGRQRAGRGRRRARRRASDLDDVAAGLGPRRAVAAGAWSCATAPERRRRAQRRLQRQPHLDGGRPAVAGRAARPAGASRCSA